MKIRVLVFPCGSEIGLEIHNALKYSNHVELLGASSISSNHGKYVYKNYLEGLPFVDNPAFVEKLNSVIEKFKVDFIFPAHDAVVLKLATHRDALKCGVIGSPADTCNICRSKSKTYEILRGKITIPKIYSLPKNCPTFPVFLKPDVGQGGRGTHVAYSSEDIEFYLKKDSALLLLEYLPGREFTIDCFTDRHRKLLFIGPRERMRISNGISVETRPIVDGRFDEMATIINSSLHLRGAWFFQVKERIGGELVLLEVAPRIAGATGLNRSLGVNLSLLSVFDAQNIDVEVQRNSYYIEMDRAFTNRYRQNISYDRVYIDLDDTIISSRGVNPWVIAFLHQCLNEGKTTHLLSRHCGNVGKTLRKHRIEALFHSVIVIGKDEEKADHISGASIFIDDSFSERQNVFRRLGIPVFDLSAIESLMDWRV